MFSLKSILTSALAVFILLVSCRAVPKAAEAEKPLKFTEFLIAGNYGYPYGIQPIDIDGDGDIDITSSETDYGEIYWYENDGKGNFKRHFIQKNDSGCPERHDVGDIDGDGDIDLMVAMNLEGDFVWFENPGTKDKLWRRHLAARYGDSSYNPNLDKIREENDGLVGRTAYDVELVDLDKDGDMDAAVSTWMGNFFAWLENTGNPRAAALGQGWKAHMIEENCGETRTIRSVDFDKDGDMDLLGSSRTGNFVAWYENSGDTGCKVFTKHIIDDESFAPVHGEPVDMDKDGDMDVVMAVNGHTPQGEPDHKILWYENDGEPKKPNWKKHIIQQPFKDAHAAIASDMDGDGDIDVVATSHRGPGKVVLFENPGDPKGTWNMQILKNNWRSTNQPIIADFNGDGRGDIAAVADRGSSELRWWRNDNEAF
ncbi:MAG: VCBS repeat-containing protein [Sedimentisphaerales bacterium]|nr:VCBS repeat-containing protein [Sedimentisphaerales bacterium]